MKKLLIFSLLICLLGTVKAETFKITAYCSCKKCCGYFIKNKKGKRIYKYSNGITASNKKIEYGMIACNWLTFGTKVNIEGLGNFTVEDRGNVRYFGNETNHIKHLDIYLPSHQEAVNFGIKYLNVQIIKEIKNGKD